VLASTAVAALALAIGGLGHPAHAQTLLVEHFDDGDAAPGGWTMLFAMSATPTPQHENSNGIQFCSDGIDNDGDGFIDCQDPDCTLAPPCGAPAPTLSSPHIVMLILLLGATGSLLLTRRRSQEHRWRRKD